MGSRMVSSAKIRASRCSSWKHAGCGIRQQRRAPRGSRTCLCTGAPAARRQRAATAHVSGPSNPEKWNPGGAETRTPGRARGPRAAQPGSLVWSCRARPARRSQARPLPAGTRPPRARPRQPPAPQAAARPRLPAAAAAERPSRPSRPGARRPRGGRAGRGGAALRGGEARIRPPAGRGGRDGNAGTSSGGGRPRGGALPAGVAAMRAAWVLLAALAALAAYYVYLPLPGTVSDPWKLMLLDATFRAVQQACHLIHYLRLSHHLIVLNYLICTFDKLKSVSSEDINITDTVFDGVEVRVFEPPAQPDGRLKRSVVYIHGGGWALASARTSLYNNLCRIMAESLNAVIVSVEYRLVPEVCFPEQFHDALRATKHFLQPDVLAEYSVDPSRIAISGDSAGGNLAAAVCQQLSKDEHLTIRPKLQALIYPVLQAFDFNTPSYQQNMNMPVLPRYVMINYWIDYFNGNYDVAHSLLINNHTALDVGQALSFRGHLNWTSLLPSSFKKNYKPVIQTTGKAEIVQEIPALLDVRAVPLLAENETLQLQPKTYILTCENDVLRDDGAFRPGTAISNGWMKTSEESVSLEDAGVYFISCFLERQEQANRSRF
uniref:Neutral cholesterol ester hydrolase 1 n=1 Tax=Falco tinnunculus TaxID=100819 RepID=A0A8C4XN92_FALTI